MAITLDLDDGAAHGALERLRDHLADPQQALDLIGYMLQQRIWEGFDQSRAPDGQPWAPLKIRRGRPLLDTGHLRKGVVYNVSGDTVSVGVFEPEAAKRAGVHQFGATIKAKSARGLRFAVGDHFVTVGSVTIPARPFLPLPEVPAPWVADIEAIVEQQIQAQWGGAPVGRGRVLLKRAIRALRGFFG